MLLAKCVHVIVACTDSDLGSKHDFGGRLEAKLSVQTMPFLVLNYLTITDPETK